MTIWEAIILGIVQGLTEFFPISSSGHLLLTQQLLGVDVESNLFLSIILHSGTLIAVIVMLRSSIIKTLKNPRKLLFWVIATIPAGIIGILLNEVIDEYLYKWEVLPITFMITAIVLLSTEVYAKMTKHHLRRMHMPTALTMGIAQAIAVIPGISRSGMTISAGVICRNDREEVAKFSFLMSIPIIAGSIFWEFLKLIRAGQTIATYMGETSVLAVIIGIVTAALTGMLAIKVMLRTVRKADYKWFSVYLVILSIIIIIII